MPSTHVRVQRRVGMGLWKRHALSVLIALVPYHISFNLSNVGDFFLELYSRGLYLGLKKELENRCLVLPLPQTVKLGSFTYKKNVMDVIFRAPGEQGMAQWWERLPPTNVARVQIPASTPYVGWVCCWFSPLLRQVFLQVLRFSPLLKTQLFQIPIRAGIR